MGLFYLDEKISAKEYGLMNTKDLTQYEMEILHSMERSTFEVVSLESTVYSLLNCQSE